MKIGLISDSHGDHRKYNIPDGLDMIIFAGDCGLYRDEYKNEPGVKDFIQWYNNLDIKYKIWVAGNHETSIMKGLIDPKELSTNCIYLENESIEIEGLNIWGSPNTPNFGYGWAFTMYPLDLKDLYKSMPDDTDIIITHGPPKDYGDRVHSGQRVGSLSLTERVIDIKPKLVVSGHIHEDRGIRSLIHEDMSETLIVNAASEYSNIKEVIIVEV